MKRMCDPFSKKLFGMRGRRLKRTLAAELAVFWGLRLVGIRLAIAPSVLYLMVSVFTFGAMGRALDSEDSVPTLKNLFLLPLSARGLLLSYLPALGLYTLLTKTAGLLAVVLAVSAWGSRELWGCVLCAVHAAVLAACLSAQKAHRPLGPAWAGGYLAALALLREPAALFSVTAASLLLALLCLSCADAYAFCPQSRPGRRALKRRAHGSVWRYLLRYLAAHKNYLVNTAALWVLACVLPGFLHPAGGTAALPLGSAVLTLNTPLCILLSCDPALEQAVRFLPGQKRAFCLPYCLFLFVCDLTVQAVFLFSWQAQCGGVPRAMLPAAVFCALQSAIGSVLLEWAFPLRGWTLEADLWHHPRKYAVPAALLLLMGFAGAVPGLLPLLLTALAAEAAALLLVCWRD